MSPSDKGKGLVVIERDLYDKMARTYVESDIPSTWTNMEKVQKEVRNHGRALAKVFALAQMKEEGTRQGATRR